MLEHVSKILAQVKGIKGARFYFIVAVLFTFSVIFLFKTEITASVNKRLDDKELKLRHSDTSKIRHVVEKICDSLDYKAYILYLYQPEKPVVKKLEMASNAELENEPRLNEFILNRQEFIETALKRSNHLLLDARNPLPGSEKYHRINGMYIPYIYIYGIRGVTDQVVGELHLWFDTRPSEEMIKRLDDGLSETSWYIYP